MIYVQINNNNCYKIPPKESLLLQNINPIIPSTRSFPESTTSIQSSGYWTTPNTPPPQESKFITDQSRVNSYLRSHAHTHRLSVSCYRAIGRPPTQSIPIINYDFKTASADTWTCPEAATSDDSPEIETRTEYPWWHPSNYKDCSAPRTWILATPHAPSSSNLCAASAQNLTCRNRRNHSPFLSPRTGLVVAAA